MSGQYKTLFSDLKLDPPHRFYAYAQTESMVGLFADLHIKLEKATHRVSKSDVWVFDEVINLIAPNYTPKSWGETIRYLVNHCKIPEGHINFSREQQSDGRILPERKIYLSRYAMCLVINDLMRDSKSLDRDLDTELFKTPDQSPAENQKDDFRNEMRISYAGYFFAHPETECEELIEITWDYIRGKRLKSRYEAAMEELIYVTRRYFGKDFDFHKFEEFKQECIFDVLFKVPGAGGTFKEQYEAMLKGLGYELLPNDNGNIKWRNGRRIAPKYPGAFFAPHVTFLLTWTIKSFCKFIQSEEKNCKIKDRKKWLELLARNFFTVIKDGIVSIKCDCAKTVYDFTATPLFTDKHHSEARKTTNALKNGTGPKTADNESGEVQRETPGLLEFWKTKTLFDEDERWCLDSRKYAEADLRKLHEKYSKNPNMETAREISKAEQEIIYENQALYGFNFQAFVDVPETLGRDGIMTPRLMVGPESANTQFYISKKPRPATPIAAPATPGFYPMLEFSQFIILPEASITIPRGVAVKRDSFVDADGKNVEYFAIANNGIYETVNPLVENPTVLRKNNVPRLVKENMQLCNFLFESDSMALENQLNLARHLVSVNVINQVVFSGSKSYHMRITVRDVPKNSEEYRWLFFYMATKLGLVSRTLNNATGKYIYTKSLIDPACCNNNRCKRRAGAIRIFEDESKVEQKLIHNTNTIYDIKWRPVYEEEQRQFKIWQEQNRRSFDFHTNNIDSFIRCYAAKNCISLSFTKGSGHNLGCVIIGAAKKAEFSDEEINSWMQSNCDRYKELIDSWRGLFSGRVGK